MDRLDVLSVLKDNAPVKKTAAYLRAKKARGEPIAALTCYDYPTAVLEEEAGVDIVLVGDSVGTNVLGYASEREVTMDDMAHHVRAVRRGVRSAYVLADMPYGSCDTPALAVENARRLLSDGADGVKVEAARPDVVRALSGAGVEVCSHLGLTPQFDDRPRYRARTASEAARFAADAFGMQAAGAALILFETIPEELARYLTERLVPPTIGIGAGRYTDGQVLVVLDVLGITPRAFRHNRRYEDLRSRVLRAVGAYRNEVAARRFPGEENLRHMEPGEWERFLEAAEAGRKT
ncbi:MAG: 3-methyl-2-oxobutanoate hydroxymethyltransferase [Lentisphaerae bacterium]|nr:3-methyl-2-oxobutanoate hydroxymethyltransferase [Lentisphaerota bacterium]